MTKLSLELDQEIRCWILGSSSMLAGISLFFVAGSNNILVELMNKGGLHDLRLLGGSRSADGMVWGIGARVGGFSAIGVLRSSITVGAAVNRGVCRRGRRSGLHWIG